MCQGCQAITNQRYMPKTVTNDSKDKQNSMQEVCLHSKQVIQRALLTQLDNQTKHFALFRGGFLEKVAPKADFAQCMSDVIFSLRNRISQFQGHSPDCLTQRVIPQSVPTKVTYMRETTRQGGKRSGFGSQSSKSYGFKSHFS